MFVVVSWICFVYVYACICICILFLGRKIVSTLSDPVQLVGHFGNLKASGNEFPTSLADRDG